MDKNFWKNKKVFITGHTGFKGSWLTLVLHSFAKICGYALDPISRPNFFDDLNLSRYLSKEYRKDIAIILKILVNQLKILILQ